MSRGATVMDHGDLSELNLEDSNGHPIMTNPSRSRVSSRTHSRYRPDDSGEEDNDIVHVGRPRSRIRHSSESSSSPEMNRINGQDVLPHTAHEFGLSSRSHRRYDSRHPSDYRHAHPNHPADYDGRSYHDDGRSYHDDGRSYRNDGRSRRDDRRPYRDDSRYRDDRSYRDRSYRDDRTHRDDRRRHRDDDPYNRERSRSRHRSRHHRGSRHHDYLEDHEGRLPTIVMFDNGRGR